MTEDFFRSRLDAMIDQSHPLAVLAKRLPWSRIEAAVVPLFAHRNRLGQTNESFDLLGASLQVAGAGVSNAGRPRLSTRLMVALTLLKNSYDLSDEELVQRFAENVYYQYFAGLEYFEPRLPCDATQIGRFRAALGEAGLEELLKATIETAVQIKAVRKSELLRIIVDTTVMEKAIAHSVDSRLLDIARRKLVSAAKRAGIVLKQTFEREGKHLRRRAGGYAHAKQFKRLKAVLRRTDVDKENPSLEIIHRGRYKSLTAQQRRWLKRRQAVEPAIGHMKSDHRMQRCWLSGATGDALHALCCAVGYNLRWLMRAVVRLGLKGLLFGLTIVAWLVRLAAKNGPQTHWAMRLWLAQHGGNASLRGVTPSQI